MDEKSSAWIPVARPAAGAAMGFIEIPRVGQEVIVDFMGGDPDQPVVVGLIHTVTQSLPYRLPGNKTQAVWRSNSTPGSDGFNEILLENAAGRELFSIKAELDFALEAGKKAVFRVGKATIMAESSGKITVVGTEFAFVSSGPVNIAGKEVSIVASGNIEIAGAAVHLSGEPVKSN
jgi:type VI secretion system secreted protein VgrG